MTVLEEDALTEWLVGYLEADTTLMSLASGIAPEVQWGTLSSPFVRVDYLDGEDSMAVGQYRVWLNATYHVRGVLHWRGQGQPDRTKVNAIGAQLDVLLHRYSGASATLHVDCWREEPTPTPATTERDGELWLQSGGIYRFLAHAV